jgi:hypothetical protein
LSIPATRAKKEEEKLEAEAERGRQSEWIDR